VTAHDLPTTDDGRIAPGVHILTEPLVLGTPGQLTTPRLRGSGRAPFGAPTEGATILRARFTGEPVVYVMDVRDAIIEDLSIVGDYYDDLLWKPQGPHLEEWPGWNVRYSPTAGIEVSDMSSGVQIRNVDIAGCAVGLVTCPDGSDGQSEFITLDHCRIAFCTYGISISHTQNRQLKVYACDFLSLHTAFVNTVHGKQQGFMDAQISSHFNQIERICDVNQGYAGVVTFQNCYGEVIGTLGRFYDGSARSAVQTAFRDCVWRCVVRGLLSDGGSLLLEGGSIETPDICVIGSSCEIRSTRFRPLWYETQAGPIPQARKIAANLACGPIPRLSDWAKRPWLPQTTAWFPSVGQDLQTGYAGPQPARRVWSLEKRLCAFDGTRITMPVALTTMLKPGDLVQDDQTLATWYVASVAGRTATVAKLTEPAPVSAVGSFVFATLATGPR
jgi:hypothetical protein